MSTVETQQETAMDAIRRNIRKAGRNWIWTILFFLSLPVTGSIYESFPLSDLSHTGLFAFQVSCFSIFISMIMSAMHYIENFNKFVGGTPFELGK